MGGTGDEDADDEVGEEDEEEEVLALELLYARGVVVVVVPVFVDPVP